MASTTDNARFAYFFRTDLAMRGPAISFLTRANRVLPESFFVFFLSIEADARAP